MGEKMFFFEHCDTQDAEFDSNYVKVFEAANAEKPFLMCHISKISKVMKIGDTVAWESQAQGINKAKQGKIIAFVLRNESAFTVLKNITGVIPNRGAKFQDFNMVANRAIVEVIKKGKKSETKEYYAPPINWLKVIK